MAAITPEQLAKWLSELLRDRLKSVLLYGSAAAGDFVEGASNYNLLVIADPLGEAELKAVAAPVAAWDRAGHPAPMLFTPEQLKSSLDAFPIEMLDIQQSRRVLFGADALAGMQIEPIHLRLAVERELTGKLLSLRGKYALAAENPRAVQDLMLGSLSTILVLFRAALRLYQDEVPDTKLEAMRELAKHIPFDPQPFERLFAAKRESAKRGGEAPVSFSAYLAAIERVVAAINQFNHPQASKP
ncbi:MAG TPA: hypothetical protein VGM76_09140 [Lacipirellulaceae bacterium]|jgi:hypothetical protein